MTLTIPASYLAPIPTIYVGGVLENRIRDMEREHGRTAIGWDVLPCGSVQVVLG